MRKQALALFTLLTLALAPSLAEDSNKTKPAAPRLVLIPDGTASLTAPSPLHPGHSQQQVLFSLVTDLIRPLRNSGGQFQLMVLCAEPLLVQESSLSRTAIPEVLKNIELAQSDCTEPGTRIDLVLRAIGDLAALESNPNYAVVMLTDGVNETASGLALEQGYQAISALAAKPPKVFAMLGVRPDLRLPWELAARKTLAGKGTQVIIGSSRDLEATLKRLKSSLAALRL